MEIPKYLYPGWLTHLMNAPFTRQHISSSFPPETILKLQALVVILKIIL